MMTGAFSKNVGKLFSELNLVTDNLSLDLFMQQPTEKLMKENTMLSSSLQLLMLSILQWHIFRALPPFFWIFWKSLMFSVAPSPKSTPPVPPKHLLLSTESQYKPSTYKKTTKELVPSVITRWCCMFRTAKHGAFENSLVCNNYANHVNSGITPYGHPRPYAILRMVRLVPNIFVYNQTREMRQSPIPYKSGQA